MSRPYRIILILLCVAVLVGCPPQEPAGSPHAARKVQLKGAGATYPGPIYQDWIETYVNQSKGSVRITYEQVGSEEGVLLFRKQKVDFAGTDCSIKAEPNELLIPAISGAIVPIYNVEGLNKTLRFTPKVLAGIFSGTIRQWNDALIQEENRGVPLPDHKIVIVHRSDGSGTTCVFSNFLAAAGGDWTGTPGFRVRWPQGSVGATSNDELAKTVRETADSIGYVEYNYAQENNLDYGYVQNKAGQFVKAGITTISAAVPDNIPEDPNRIMNSLLQVDSERAYPISSVTWLLVPKQSRSPEKREALVRFLNWAMEDGQVIAGRDGYARLPEPLVARAREDIKQIH